MRALRVVGWLGLMLAATVPVVAQGLPAPTNPNLDHLGYYFTNERYGNQTAEAFPYTNLYVAVTDGYDTGVANWQGPLDASLAAAVAAGKDIFLMLVEKNQGSQVITWDDILDVAEPYWASVKYVEVAHEENLSAAQMDARISLLNTKLAARSLGGRSTVALFTTTTIFTTDALDSTALDLVGIEAYLDGPGSSTSSDNVNALNSYLEDAKGPRS